MRGVSFFEKVEFDFPGSVYKNALVFGDVDNDNYQELIVANECGDLHIFKGGSNKCWRKARELGMVIITTFVVYQIFQYLK